MYNSCYPDSENFNPREAFYSTRNEPNNVWVLYYGSESNSDKVIGVYSTQERAIGNAVRLCRDTCDCVNNEHTCDDYRENGDLCSKSLSADNVSTVGMYSIFPVPFDQTK